jgi:protein tyrosine phosphatase (PTP) superfamily phosphohydrolase (DUF442 family)
MTLDSNPSRRRTRAAALAALILAACQAGSTGEPTKQVELQIAPPSAASGTPIQLPGLHNVVTYADRLVCGGVPEGEQGLETLAAMGIKTVVSVDGATPDVAAAERLGMRYVHLPVSYDTITKERQLQLAQAIASSEGPIYMHCHHGKHRSAAALASAVVLAGVLTADQAAARMAVSGTAKDYTGLWQAVAEAAPLPASQLRIDPSTLPKISKVSGLVATMAEIDQVIDLVKQAHHAGWKAPEDHPDLVPAKETARLKTLFANLANDPESRQLPADYQTQLIKVIEASDGLDAAVRDRRAEVAEKLLAAINKSCKDCHASYRDK